MPDRAVLVISGIPGAGKSTVAAMVARRLPRSAHIEAEVLQRFVVGGSVWPDGDPREEAMRQLRLRGRNVPRLDVVRERNRQAPEQGRVRSMAAPVSIELVPRSRAAIIEDLDVLRREFPTLDMVNSPDLLRFDFRSWDACAVARGRLGRAIPHIRAMDFPIKASGRLAALLGERGLGEVLVVRGDSPQDLARPVHATTSVELIRALKQVDPGLRIYAGFDPYRQGLRAEVDSVHEKIEAGASGLFTQPFFDLGLLQVCADLLPRTEIFWGISPVLTPATRRYWEVKNRAVFPSGFEPTLAWNRAFASKCLDWAREVDASLYFMPIRLGLSEYLGGLL